jgi:tyrosyl-tRNA synthetase
MATTIPQGIELTEDEKRRYLTIRSIGEECIMEEELANLVKTKKTFIAYDGFEPSGQMHIAQAILKAINVNKLTSCGATFIFWIADWFALLNNKMDGDLKRIQTVGKYFIEVWKAAGMKMENVKFIWSSEEILSHANEYFSVVFDIARKTSLNRIVRCTQIMGRSETDDLTAAQIMYPAMQCADIFHLKIDICQLGMDQRKVNMLAREYCDEHKLGRSKPIILSHHMLLGLKEGQEKMSKSQPDSAIFVEDDEQMIHSKIKKAYCPPGVVEKNPVLDYVKHICFEHDHHFIVKRSESNDGDVTYDNYAALEKDFVEQKLHPADLKNALAISLNEMVRPIRDHFENDPVAKQLLAEVKSFKVTR